MHAKSLQLCLTLVTLWTVVLQAPLSMGFSRQEYWSGCHAFLQGIFPIQGLNPCLLCLLHWHVGSLPPEQPGKPKNAIDTSNTDSVKQKNQRM